MEKVTAMFKGINLGAEDCYFLFLFCEEKVGEFKVSLSILHINSFFSEQQSNLIIESF